MAKELTYPRIPPKSKRYSRVQKKGQVTIPAELRNRHGIEEGDIVSFIERPDGILISSRKAELFRALDELGEGLRDAGISLEDLIESGRVIREEISQEEYGHLFDK